MSHESGVRLLVFKLKSPYCCFNIISPLRQDGNTALHEVSWHGFSQCVKLLVKAGADAHIKNKVNTPNLSNAVLNKPNQTYPMQTKPTVSFIYVINPHQNHNSLLSLSHSLTHSLSNSL